MMSRFLAALLAIPLLAFDAASAQGVGGYVVPDPYAGLPPIRLPKPSAEPQYVPPAGVVPDRRAPAATPGEALGIIVRDRLARELDRVLPGARRGRWDGERRYHKNNRGRGRGDDDDRDDDDDDDDDDD